VGEEKVVFLYLLFGIVLFFLCLHKKRTKSACLQAGKVPAAINAPHIQRNQRRAKAVTIEIGNYDSLIVVL
jgi:hypothetical protein